MIKDLKLGIAMMQNGIGSDSAISVFILVAGIMAVFTLLLPLPILSGLYISACAGGVIWQVYSTTISTLVQTSPHKKKLRTIIPVYLAVIVMLIANTFCIAMHGLAYLRMRENKEIALINLQYDPITYANTIVMGAILIVVVSLVMILINIFYKIGSAVLIGACVWFRFFWDGAVFRFWNISIETGIILSYGVVLIGCVILYVVNCLIYKYEYSELAVRSIIKRASK